MTRILGHGARLLTAALLATGLLGAAASVADAKCVRLAFEVNDYGKEGPTKDAKALLDKHIAKWTADRGITRYSKGKKSVNCKLFLDFGFFDEHTCKAEATVCWSPGSGNTAKPAPAKTQGSKPQQTAPAARQKAASNTTMTTTR